MAGCGCRGNSGAMTVRRTMGEGPIVLAGYENDTEGYKGPSMVVAIVDRGGPNQRIFPGYMLSEAAVVASQHGSSLETVHAHRLPAAALVGIAPS